MTTKLNFGVLIIDLSFHTNVWRLSPFRIIFSNYLAYFSYEQVVESRHNMLLKALTLHVSCLFFKPEAVSKHSVSLWIGYSECYVNSINLDETLALYFHRLHVVLRIVNEVIERP